MINRITIDLVMKSTEMWVNDVLYTMLLVFIETCIYICMHKNIYVEKKLTYVKKPTKKT